MGLCSIPHNKITNGVKYKKNNFVVSVKFPAGKKTYKINQSDRAKNLRTHFFPHCGSMHLNRPNLRDLRLAFLLKRRKPIRVD